MAARKRLTERLEDRPPSDEDQAMMVLVQFMLKNADLFGRNSPLFRALQVIVTEWAQR